MYCQLSPSATTATASVTIVRPISPAGCPVVITPDMVGNVPSSMFLPSRAFMVALRLALRMGNGRSSWVLQTKSTCRVVAMLHTDGQGKRGATLTRLWHHVVTRGSGHEEHGDPAVSHRAGLPYRQRRILARVSWPWEVAYGTSRPSAPSQEDEFLTSDCRSRGRCRRRAAHGRTPSQSHPTDSPALWRVGRTGHPLSSLSVSAGHCRSLLRASRYRGASFRAREGGSRTGAGRDSGNPDPRISCWAYLSSAPQCRHAHGQVTPSVPRRGRRAVFAQCP